MYKTSKITVGTERKSTAIVVSGLCRSEASSSTSPATPALSIQVET
jgi:hypothetical protein